MTSSLLFYSPNTLSGRATVTGALKFHLIKINMIRVVPGCGIDKEEGGKANDFSPSTKRIGILCCNVVRHVIGWLMTRRGTDEIS